MAGIMVSSYAVRACIREIEFGVQRECGIGTIREGMLYMINWGTRAERLLCPMAAADGQLRLKRHTLVGIELS